MSHKRILLIDDDPVSNLVTKRSIQKSGLLDDVQEIIVFNNPFEGIRFLEGDWTNESMHTILLLDINMPKIDGFQLMETISAWPEKKNLKVAILSSSELGSDKERAFQFAMMEDFFSKPIHTDAVLRIVELFNTMNS
jgi:CheY-like chemotaxis protein